MSLPTLTDLRNQLAGELLTDAYSLGMYSTDASVYQIQPKAVVLPKNEADVQLALRFAAQHQWTLLPRGGGTSLAGQTVGDSLILDFSRHFRAVVEVNAEEQWVRVQPGLPRDELNAYLAPHGLHFAPDPATSSRANVGGMVGNNSSGTKSILYGKTVDHVLEAKVALADGTQLQLKALSPEAYQTKCEQQDREGELYREFRALVEANRQEVATRFPKVMRRVGGYNLDEFIHTDHWNLAKLITGSEGTLALTLELKLNLVPLPKHKSVCVVHFAEVNEAIKAVEPMLAFQPAAIEILDDTVVRLSRENLTTQRHAQFLVEDPAAILIVEFYGDTARDVAQRPERMVEDLKQRSLGYAYPIFPEGATYESVWVIRKKGLGLMLGIKGAKKPLPFIEDAGIPTEHLPEYIERVLAVCKEEETEVAMYAHASVGVIHVRPILDLRQEADIRHFKNIAEKTFRLVQEYGGSWSGEHGDGLVRSPFNREYFGEQLYEAFREVKRLFDPENRMNPGKIVEAPPMDQNLRYGKQYEDQAMETVYQYRQEQSFGDSVHMCTGVGECRKMLGGTMCPSFKATRQEEHSTRGRANALRLAMSGQLGEEGLTSDRLQEALDLCLSCKACKSECPSNVDMAKLKSEVRQQYYDQHGVSLRDRLIGRSPEMAARFAGWKAGFINQVQGSRPFKWLLERQAGVDQRRTLPAYASETFVAWFARNQRQPKEPIGTVALFADTYLNFHEPQIGRAAAHLLWEAGYQVQLAAVGCCQRPRISHGLLREASTHGEQTAKNLDIFLKAGTPILVCESSCASALVDDLPDLIQEDGLAARLQSGVMPLETFLRKEIEAGKCDLPWSSEQARVHIHGHCHQKALFGTADMRFLLEKSGAKVEEIPSGCCGMAGSFGYEKEHYDLSQKIGEQVLFPAIRALNGEAVVACGFSCRHQIADATGKQARHWVEWLQGTSQ